MVCHLEASVGSTAPVKDRRVLNDPKGFSGADFDKIPVSIMFDVIVRTAVFVLWAMQLRRSHLCCIAHQKKRADSVDKFTTGSTLTSVFFLLGISKFCCNSSCVGSMRKCFTRLHTLWCTRSSVAKRQQFSCPLRA